MRQKGARTSQRLLKRGPRENAAWNKHTQPLFLGVQVVPADSRLLCGHGHCPFGTCSCLRAPFWRWWCLPGRRFVSASVVGVGWSVPGTTPGEMETKIGEEGAGA